MLRLSIISMSLMFSMKALAFENYQLCAIEYPPIIQSSSKPEQSYGVAGDIIIAAFKAVNIDIGFDFVPMIRTVRNIEDKQCPALVGTIAWFNRDNKSHLVEAIDLLKLNFLLFYKKTNFPNGFSFQNLTELGGYKIGNVHGSATVPLVKKANLDVEYVSKIELNFKKLMADRIDFAIGIDISGWALLDDLDVNSNHDFEAAEQPVLTIPISLLFSKEQTYLIDQFNKGIDIIIKNGLFYSIAKRYYDKNLVPDAIFPNQIKHKVKQQSDL